MAVGHACVIYDKRDVSGGLNTTGVAPYKMKADRSADEVEWILGIGGIEVRHGVEVGRDTTWDALLDAHDALFLGVGLGPDTVLAVPGVQRPNIHGAVDYIERLKLGTVDLSSVERVAVVGGGNTAVDAVRELRGLGAEHVTMVYRGAERWMSGYAHEWAAAKQEGVRAHWQAQPVAFEGEGSGEGSGPVQGIRCVRLTDDKQPIEGSEHVVRADLVLLAIGQSKLEALLSGLPGLTFERGAVVVDEHQATAREGVFAGGDCANGGKEVVNAAAEGKRAAVAIDRYLRGPGG